MATPLLHSNFQSWQMRSLPTLDLYRILNYVNMLKHLLVCGTFSKSSYDYTFELDFDMYISQTGKIP